MTEQLPEKIAPAPMEQSTSIVKRNKNQIITLGVLIILVGAGYWIYTRYLFPNAFTPVELSQKEQQVLKHKLERLGVELETGKTKSKRERLEPEPYREIDANREVFFTEKEINGLLAHNTDLADKLAIDLSDNLISAKLLVDLDPDMPLFGGKTLKVTAGMELVLLQGKPRAVLKGVSVWGVPLPNAWLGDLKNVDLLHEYGNAGGFWEAVNRGIEEVEAHDGKLRIKLKK